MLGSKVCSNIQIYRYKSQRIIQTHISSVDLFIQITHNLLIADEDRKYIFSF